MAARGGHPRSCRILVLERRVGGRADIEPHDRTVKGTIAGDVPTPSPAPEANELGIFPEVGGWITFLKDGIWAVKPTPGSVPTDRIQLSESARGRV